MKKKHNIFSWNSLWCTKAVFRDHWCTVWHLADLTLRYFYCTLNGLQTCNSLLYTGKKFAVREEFLQGFVYDMQILWSLEKWFKKIRGKMKKQKKGKRLHFTRGKTSPFGFKLYKKNHLYNFLEIMHLTVVQVSFWMF